MVLPAADSALVLADAGADQPGRSPKTKSKGLCSSCRVKLRLGDDIILEGSNFKVLETEIRQQIFPSF